MASGKQQFDLKSSGSGSTTWSGKMEDLQKLLSNLHPEKLENCSTAFSNAAGKLQATAEEIYTVGFQLSQLWKGDAAAKAQEQLKQLWETSQNLADTAFMVGNNLFHNHYLTLKDAPKQAPQPQHWGEGIGAGVGTLLGPIGTLGGDYLGGKWDDGHNNDLARDWVNNTLTPAADSDNSGVPDNFRTDLPDAKQALNDPHNKKQPDFNGGGGLPHGGGGGGAPGGKLPTHPGGNLPTHPAGGNLPTHPGGNLPTHPGGNLPTHPGGGLPGHGGSDLAGLHPVGGSPGGGLGPGLGGGGGGLGGGLGGGGLGGAGGGLGGGLGGPGLNGAGSLAAQEAAAAERAMMAGKGGANGMPMGGMGGGGGGQKEERERTTWLSEDEDVWGGDGDTAPPVIG